MPKTKKIAVKEEEEEDLFEEESGVERGLHVKCKVYDEVYSKLLNQKYLRGQLQA